MVLSPVVSIVGFTRPPIKFELVLAFAVSKPVEAHIHGFCAFGLHLAINDGISHGIVGLDGSRWLFVAHFFEDDSNVDCLTSHDVEGCKFGFGGRRHNMFDDVGDIEYGTIVAWHFFIMRKEKVATGSAPSLGFVEVAGVTVHSENHLATIVGEDGFVLGC